MTSNEADAFLIKKKIKNNILSGYRQVEAIEVECEV